MPDLPTTLYIARHGRSASNNQGLVTGQLDVGLSAKGLAQSQALAHCLQAEPLDAVYASALQRTIATAQPTADAQRLPVRVLPALNEIHMGVLQGRHRDDRDPQAQALWAQWQADPWGFCVPGGEPMPAFAQRVEAALQQLLQHHRGQRILVVGHRATNRVLLGTLLGWPRARWGEIGPRNKYFYRLVLGTAAPCPPISTYTLGGSKSGQRVDEFIM